MSHYKEIFGTSGLSLIFNHLGKKKGILIDYSNAEDYIDEIFDEAISVRPNFHNWEVMTAVAYIVYCDNIFMLTNLSTDDWWEICRKAVNSYNGDKSRPFKEYLEKHLQEYEDAKLGILE